MKKLLQSLFILLFVAFSATAQERTITGTVTAKEDGLPLPGVTVKQPGTKGGTITDASGKFTIKVTANASLQFGSIGYTTKIVRVTGASLNISLEGQAQELNDVIVVAYGTSTKGAFTGAASSIKAGDIAKRTLTNVNSALAGSAPGIQVNSGSGQPGEGPNIRIRGFGSVSSSNSPLYIVDGIQYPGNIGDISADDIESISVLKDAASSSLYGSSAANGVILITTKKGKIGKDQLNIKVIQGLSSRSIPEYDRVNAMEYYPLAWQAYRNSLVYPTTGVGVPLATANTTATNGIKALLFNNPFNVADNAIVGTDGLLNPNASLLYGEDQMDWRKPLSRVGSRGDYNMSVSGGADKSDYYISLGYLNEKGYVIRSDFNRVNGRVSVNSRPTTWFKTGLNITGNISKSNQADGTGSTSFVNPFSFSRSIGPIYPVYAHDPTNGALLYDANGQQIYDTGNLSASLGVPNRPAGASPGRHILEETLLNSTVIKRNALSGRTYGEISFLKDFKFTTNVGVDVSNYQFNDYQNKIVGDGAPGGRARNTEQTTTSYTIEQLLNYTKIIGKNTFGAIVGHNNYNYQFKYLTGARNTQILDGNTELINFATTTDLSSYQNNYTKEAYFGRLNYDYDNKYYVSGSYRRDASSKWAPGKKWGGFWSVSGGWILSQESFIKDISWINYLKVRSSYGSLGNDGILNTDGTFNYYPYLGQYSLGQNNASEPGVLLSTLPNPNISWETITQTDAAVEYALFKNRLRGSIEFFNKKSTDLLFNVPLPLSNGLGIGSATGIIQKNIGDMYNRGIEIQIGGDIVKNRSFKWEMNINWTKFSNKITRMPVETPTIIQGTKQLAEGHSIYDFWLRQWAGVDPLDGAGLYLMDPKNPASAADTRTVNGQLVTVNPGNALYAYTNSAIPKFMGSITNTFTYKNFSLNVLVNYSVGGKFYDSNYQNLMAFSSYGSSIASDALNSWKKVGDVTDVPRLDVGRSAFNNATSSRFLIDASYLSMRSATLSYAIPKTVVHKLGMSVINVFATGENLFLLSKRKGLDPTEGFNGTNSNAYIPSRLVSLGINATF
ncbi:TonB-dependent receptor [Pedobacter sp. PAMC26386]|nr:TonB-dependent receptor [Pedobacter sp. PAMC26386]